MVRIRLPLLVLGTLMAPAVAWAQASIAGVVRDPSGGVLPGVTVELFNALNANAVLTENASFAVFRQPLSVLNPRLVKVSANLEF